MSSTPLNLGIACLRYGVRNDEIADPELAHMWHEMQELCERIAPIASTIDRKLGRAA